MRVGDADRMVPHVDVESTPQSRAKEFFRAANGHKVYNEGQKLATMMTKEGTKRYMRFTVCDVSKGLGSMPQMCTIGHRVVFNPPWDHNGSYIEHVETKERMQVPFYELVSQFLCR